MKTRLTLALMAFALILSTGCSKPEEKLAKHTEKMGAIMEDNLESPKDGVEELHEYMRDNLPEMMSLVGEMMTELDQIEDGSERADRAKEMVTTLKEAAEAQKETGTKFAMAAMADKDVQEYVEKHGGTYEKTAEALMDGDLMEGLGPLMGMGGRSKRRSKRPSKSDLDED